MDGLNQNEYCCPLTYQRDLLTCRLVSWNVSRGLFQELNYKSIRVDSPLVMVVNGRKLGAEKQALTSLSLVAKSE